MTHQRNTDTNDTDEQYSIFSNKKVRTLFFSGDFTAASVTAILAELVTLEAHAKGDQRITFLISSNGGDIRALATLQLFINASNALVNIVATDYVFSSALLLLACHKHGTRLCLPHTLFFQHAGGMTYVDGSPKAQKNESKISEALNLQHTQAYCKAIGISYEEWLAKNSNNEDTDYFSAEDALKRNIVDKILTPEDLQALFGVDETVNNNSWTKELCND